jgi:DMSO/TMAO reductase YedYZ molybdopterin-dependent catalytic subunit
MSDKEIIIISPDTQRKNRIPPGQRLVDSFPVLHYDGIPKFDADKWTFRIWGLVEKERKLTFNEFVYLPHVKVFSDIHCVTGWSKLDNHWQGISTSEIKNLVNIKPEAKHVMIYCSDDYYTNLSFEDFFQPDVLFALKFNNEDVSLEHGYPVRLVVPRLYLWKSAKWVNGIQFLAKDTPGFWESRGYHNHGDPWKEERYSR